jgi:hypothetical protein
MLKAANLQVDNPDPGVVTSAGEAKTYAGVRRAVWTLGALMLVLISAFDLGPPLAFNDDWIYAWSVRHLNLLHTQLYPSASAPALPQIAWAWLATLGHADQRLLRLSIIPFVVIAMWALYRLARHVGADKTWSAMAAISPLAFPVFSADATTFMSDVPYVALIIVSALGAVKWAGGGGKRWIGLCVTLAVLATLQRQTGAAIPLGVTAALWLKSGGRRSWRGMDLVGQVALWSGCLCAIALPSLIGFSTPTQGSRLATALGFHSLDFILALMFLPGMLGLGLVLFLPGMALSSSPLVGWKRVRPWIFRLVILELVVLTLTGTVFAGNVFTPFGFTSNIDPAKMGIKPHLFALPIFLVIEILAVAALVAFVRRWHDWWRTATGRGGLTLLLLSLSQFLPLLLAPYIFDRYYLASVLLLSPIAARTASQGNRPVLAARLALALMAASTVLYVAGEQDYQAWMVARNQATCLAYQYASPMEVYAGYEAMAVYVEVPYYEHHGVVLGGAAVSNNPFYFSLQGPSDPLISVQFAPSNDPRPGYNYSSLASAKLVLVPGPSGRGLNIQAPSGQPPACPPTG